MLDGCDDSKEFSMSLQTCGLSRVLEQKTAGPALFNDLGPAPCALGPGDGVKETKRPKLLPNVTLLPNWAENPRASSVLHTSTGKALLTPKRKAKQEGVTETKLPNPLPKKVAFVQEVPKAVLNSLRKSMLFPLAKSVPKALPKTVSKTTAHPNVARHQPATS